VRRLPLRLLFKVGLSGWGCPPAKILFCVFFWTPIFGFPGTPSPGLGLRLGWVPAGPPPRVLKRSLLPLHRSRRRRRGEPVYQPGGGPSYRPSNAVLGAAVINFTRQTLSTFYTCLGSKVKSISRSHHYVYREMWPCQRPPRVPAPRRPTTRTSRPRRWWRRAAAATGRGCGPSTPPLWSPASPPPPLHPPVGTGAASPSGPAQGRPAPLPKGGGAFPSVGLPSLPIELDKSRCPHSPRPQPFMASGGSPLIA